MSLSQETLDKSLKTCIFCKWYIRYKRLCGNTGKKADPLFLCEKFKAFTTEES